MNDLSNTSNFSSTNNFAPDTELSSFNNEVFTPNDPLSFAVFGRVAPASTKVPTGEILLDGSISFNAAAESKISIKTDNRGRIVEMASNTGEKTDLGYDKDGVLCWLKRSDGEVITKSDDGWIDGNACRWSVIIPLLDGTLWCKKSNDVIVEKKIDGLFTWHNLRDKFILWFDKKKRIVGIRYPNGQSRAFAYDARGLCMVTEPDSSKFILKDRVWQNEKDSTVQIFDLTLSNDGTLTYRIGKFFMSTTASGKLTRTIAQGEARQNCHEKFLPPAIQASSFQPLV